MKSLKELLSERSALDESLTRAKRDAEVAGLRQVHELIKEFGFTAQQVFPWKASTSSTRVEAKYKNPETAETWTGRGKPPRWIVGKDRADFLIVREERRQEGPFLAEMAAQAAQNRRF
jgi:DNA-binding protein H-NS